MDTPKNYENLLSLRKTSFPASVGEFPRLWESYEDVAEQKKMLNANWTVLIKDSEKLRSKI
jgi:hypothetical protein